jgi:hypothetical protein
VAAPWEILQVALPGLMALERWKENKGMQADGLCMWMLAACIAWKA